MNKFCQSCGMPMKTLAFYRKWGHYPGAAKDAKEMKGPALALLNKQSALAPALIELAKGMLLSAPEYVERIKRHYALFRNKIETGMSLEPAKSNAPRTRSSRDETGQLCRGGPVVTEATQMSESNERRLGISYEAIDRMCEEFLQTHPLWAERESGVPSLKLGRSMTDAQLLTKLHDLGIDIDRVSLAERVRRQPSSEALSKALIREVGVDLPDTQEADWPWIGIVVLWERWFPDEPCFEILSKRIAQGYDYLQKKDSVAASEVWLLAWQAVPALARKLNTCEMSAFDKAFGGYQSVFNWCQEVSDALGEAGRADSSYFRKQIAYGDSLLATFHDLDPLIAQNTRRSIAEAHFILGEKERGDALFRAWLADDPQWGWGWIGWSDCHAWPCFGIKDPLTSERILREGLAVSGVRDRADLVDRLQDVRSDAGLATPPDSFLSAPVPAPKQARPAVGRNAPCPCGSGKKHKKCCLAQDEAARRG